jgi:hypothetical protein
MTEYDLQYKIWLTLQGSNNLFIPNVNGGYGEMDVLRLTRAGYAYEYEIKITRADFRADKKKELKHESYSKVFNNLPFCWWDGRPKNQEGIPNYFIYVAPKGVIPVDELPEYAGLYELENGLLSCVKPPKKIHKEKQRDYWETKALWALNAKYLYHYWLKLKDKNNG